MTQPSADQADWVDLLDAASSMAGEVYDWLSAAGPPPQVILLGALGSILATIITTIVVALWIRRRRAKADAFDPGRRAESSNLSSSLSPEIVQRLRDLLLGLRRWNDTRARGHFIAVALATDPAVLSEIECDGTGRDCAMSLIQVCADRTDPATGEPLLCVLLAAIPAEFGAKPDRDAEIAELKGLLGCP